MITSQVVQGQTGQQLPTTSTSTDPYSTMGPSDFIQLMVTQLQNQDPTSPTSSADIMQQMSQIGSLEASTQMQTTMKNMAQQTSIGSAASLIGKSVTGIDSTNATVSGTVSSVSVAGGVATLNLNDGSAMPLTGLSTVNSAG